MKVSMSSSVNIEVKSNVKCIIWCLMLLSIMSQTEAGSCRESALCCNGRDSSCVVQKTPINSIGEDPNEKPCYCDHACLKLGDCCGDFKSYCGVIDCLLSEWGQWSECDAKCGSGTRTRTRTVLRAAEMGGKHCGSLIQRQGCEGYRCKTFSERKILSETAMLLPSEFSKSRRENDTIDIRRNLKYRNADFHHHSSRDHEYCVEFEVIKATKACRKDPSYKLLEIGDRITAKCDLEAFITQNERDEEINENEIEREEDNETINDHRTIKKSKFRCKGEGATGRNTRFQAMAIPACHGKWMRLSLGQPKRCSHHDAQYIFV